MQSFLRHTAESILEKLDWKQLRNTTLVLPSHRAGLVLKEELLRLQQERHAQAVWAPTVLTLTNLQDALSPLYAEDELFTIVRLYQLYQQYPHTEAISLDLFYNWGRQMIADFTNIDASMPAEEVPNFFANTIAAHELSTWQLDPETEERLRNLVSGSAVSGLVDKDSVKRQYEVLWRQMGELYRALRTQMAAEGKGYTGMRQRAVIEHWEEESVQQQLSGRTFVFVGFNYLLPVERELMERLRDAEQALFYWDYVPNFETNEKAFSFAQHNAGILGAANPLTANPLTVKPITVIRCVSREAQAQYVHRWLQQNYTAKGQKVGVVICDETMLESVIYTLPAITLPGEETPVPINITKGFPLRNTAVYARVLAWLNDPVRGQADMPVSPTILDELATFLGFVEAAESEETESNTSPLSWQELLILESEYQVRKLINQLRSLLNEGLGVVCTLKLLRLLLRRMMENVTMPFHGEPVTDIQIMGVLETRMLDFDRLLLLNVEEGVIPQRQADSSFIPYYLRKTYHMQTADERATIYAYNFFRLLNRTDHATLLYASADSTEGSKGMSRFVMQMRYSPRFEVTYADLNEASEPTSSACTIESTSTSLLSRLKVDERGVLRKDDGHRYRLSPSAINTFISCRRSFYLQYLLGLNPQNEDEVLFESNTMGSFVHHAMEYLYRTYLHCDNSQPVPVTPEAIEELLTEEKLEEALLAAYEAMNEKENEHPYIPEHHRGENVVIKGYIRHILERDREDAKVGLQIVLLEQERTFPVYIEGVGEILTGGIIDRLDIYGPEGHQHLRVVDYKSGNYTDTTHAKRMTSSWEELMESEEKGYVRQTLIYSHAVCAYGSFGLPVEPHLYFCRRSLTDIETRLAIEGNTVSDYKTIAPTFYEALRTKAKEILTTTEFPQCEEDQCPAFCPFFTLCGRQAKEI